MDYLDELELELIDMEYENWRDEKVRKEYLKSQNLEEYI
jgi:hypothetical protein|nr:MAG TPA: hypothetical protein [Caudoviricetes sp.]